MKTYKIIISGGGTGGHIFPALAIGKLLEKKIPNIKILFVGAKGRMEMEKIPKEGYEIKGLWISGFQRRITFKNILFPFKLIHSIYMANKILNKYSPDLVIGTGGYASGPLLYMAAYKKIPSIIQEQNSFPGITNKILSRHVNKICVAYNDMEKFFPKDKICFTGNPVRNQILNFSDKRVEGIKYFNLDPSYLTVLVIGGSLGALSINNTIHKNIDFFKKESINLIWQTGISFLDKAKNVVKEIDLPNINAYNFIQHMDLAYAAADIIISRAGAIAISELCCVGKPVILIPSPNVSENHQYKNAQSLVNKNAALLVEDSKASCKLVVKLLELINDSEMRASLSKNILALGVTDASNQIVKICSKIIKYEIK
ncbi:MAG: undecaprenyldiphospho-muramoylpentapeptide beta-N-acetylglucosaminyltransferase [Bacteroidota bacterium]|nr:undecaprenyldiphospho-muramoylpentapeptide beta-N-acetylglucosaminyltransferase [Bacteroidota bacterium]